jgi:hypothetical protein
MPSILRAWYAARTMTDETTAEGVQAHPLQLAIAPPIDDTTEATKDHLEAPEFNDVAAFMEGVARCDAPKLGGGACGQPVVGPGATVCRLHGGAAPQVQEAAITRLREARDGALDALIEALSSRGDKLDPRTLLDVVTKLTTQVELLEGRVTGRTESHEFKLEESRATFTKKLDALASSYERAPKVLDMIDKMMGEGDYAEAEIVEEAADG